MKKIMLFWACCFAFLIPFGVNAQTTYNYACSDWQTSTGSPTCNTDILTGSPGDGMLGGVFGVGGNNLSAGTWYVSFVVAGAAGQFRTNGDIVDGSYEVFSSDVVDFPYTVPNGNSESYLKMEWTSGGDFGPVCVSDTPGVCIPSPAPFIETATSSIEQTQNNLFFGYWTFFGSLIFVVWLFRSARK